MWENGIRRQTWRLKKNHLGRFLISMRSFLRHGKRRASRTNSSTKGHRLITYGQPLSGTGNKNERPPRTRPFCSRGAIAAASPLFRQPRRPHPEKSGGLNGSMQHSLAVYLRESQNPKLFAAVNLTPSRLFQAQLVHI